MEMLERSVVVECDGRLVLAICLVGVAALLSGEMDSRWDARQKGKRNKEKKKQMSGNWPLCSAKGTDCWMEKW